MKGEISLDGQCQEEDLAACCLGLAITCSVNGNANTAKLCVPNMLARVSEVTSSTIWTPKKSQHQLDVHIAYEFSGGGSAACPLRDPRHRAVADPASRATNALKAFIMCFRPFLQNAGSARKFLRSSVSAAKRLSSRAGRIDPNGCTAGPQFSIGCWIAVTGAV